MLYNFKEKKPKIDSPLFIADNAAIIGDVTIGKNCSIWFGAVIRGDEEPIYIGERTNIQDNATLHVAEGISLTIGNGVTVGHNAVLHGCTVGNDALIGIGAVILNNAVIGDESIVGAGALVTENKVFPKRSLILGSPAKVIRELSNEEVEQIRENGRVYIDLAKETEASNK